ncbi:MAG: hypothetical protein ABJA98_00245 [Acidobacteriota bacterium]
MPWLNWTQWTRHAIRGHAHIHETADACVAARHGHGIGRAIVGALEREATQDDRATGATGDDLLAAGHRGTTGLMCHITRPK